VTTESIVTAISWYSIVFFELCSARIVKFLGHLSHPISGKKEPTFPRFMSKIVKKMTLMVLNPESGHNLKPTPDDDPSGSCTSASIKFPKCSQETRPNNAPRATQRRKMTRCYRPSAHREVGSITPLCSISLVSVSFEDPVATRSFQGFWSHFYRMVFQWHSKHLDPVLRPRSRESHKRYSKF